MEHKQLPIHVPHLALRVQRPLHRVPRLRTAALHLAGHLAQHLWLQVLLQLAQQRVLACVGSLQLLQLLVLLLQRLAVVLLQRLAVPAPMTVQGRTRLKIVLCNCALAIRVAAVI